MRNCSSWHIGGTAYLLLQRYLSLDMSGLTPSSGEPGRAGRFDPSYLLLTGLDFARVEAHDGCDEERGAEAQRGR
jgi:hypothetical protein